MRTLLILIMLFASINVFAQKDTKTVKLEKQVVEASCGMCQFGLAGDECKLAVKIDGKAYYVEGSEIDDHGDAHAKDGLCSTVKKAEVSGKLADGKFKATHFKMLAQKGDDDHDHDHHH
ncbi:MAG: hypothetical protein HC831_08820 [Chloroflexia bacterium]|nr:hypothetical protein [Chloroflexia bacterium]